MTKNFISFLSGFVLMFVFFDFFLKLTFTTPPILKYYDPKFGARNRPNIEYLKSVEGLFLGKTNYDGRFRENYPKRKSNKKALRILLIGDSFVEGIDVFSRHHFASVLEKNLQDNLQTDVEVLDFGRGNCSLPASSYYYINYIDKEYDADLVLYFVEIRDKILDPLGYPSTTFEYDSKGDSLKVNFNWKFSTEYKIDQLLKNSFIFSKYNDIAVIRLLFRAWGGIKSRGIIAQIFDPLGIRKEIRSIRDLPDELKTNEVSLGSKKVFQRLATSSNKQMIFVLRNHPFSAKVLKDYLSKKYLTIDLDEVMNGANIINNNRNAYYFKATGSSGGHYNHDGHKALGDFLATKLQIFFCDPKSPFQRGTIENTNGPR